MGGGYRDYVYEEVEKLLDREELLSTDKPSLPGLSFSTALEMLKAGSRVARKSWGSTSLTWIELIECDTPYLAIVDDEGFYMAWIPQQSDLLQEDWCYVPRDERS